MRVYVNVLVVKTSLKKLKQICFPMKAKSIGNRPSFRLLANGSDLLSLVAAFQYRSLVGVQMQIRWHLDS